MASFGEELKRERTLREISLREVAESTKISIRHLEALENNEFDSLPEGTVFRKGYVRAYCDHIGIDADAMLNAYLLEERSRAERGGAADDGMMRGSGVRAGVAGSPSSTRDPRRATLWILLAAVAAVIIVGGLAWWAWRARGQAGPDSTSSIVTFRAGELHG